MQVREQVRCRPHLHLIRILPKIINKFLNCFLFFRLQFQAGTRIDLILILQILPISNDVIDDFLSVLDDLLIVRFLRSVEAFHSVLFGA